MRVLVTGGAGFIGSHFVKRLLARGEDVVVLDKLTYAGNPANLEGMGVELVVGDIADGEDVTRAIGHGADAIVNFAAETHVDRSILDGGDFLRTNILGVNVLLELARETGLRLVHVSTDEVYGDLPPGLSSREEDALCPSSPYSAAKAGERSAPACPCPHIRRGRADHPGCRTPTGPTVSREVLPLFVTNALDGSSRSRFTETATRFATGCHVEDHCAGIELALREGAAGDVYNIGGGRSSKPRDHPEDPGGQPVPDQSLVRQVDDRPGHDRRYSLDTLEARTARLDGHRAWQRSPATVPGTRDHRAWWEPVKQSDATSVPPATVRRAASIVIRAGTGGRQRTGRPAAGPSPRPLQLASDRRRAYGPPRCFAAAFARLRSSACPRGRRL